MRAHLNYKTPRAWVVDHNVYVTENDRSAFGYLGNEGANGKYFFGGYNEDVMAILSGVEDGQSVYQEIPYQFTLNINDVCTFLSSVKNYLVNVEHKMSSEKYDLMIEGVRAYGVAEDYLAYGGAPTVFWGFGSTGLEVNIMAGTHGLKEAAEAWGFFNVAQVVDNIFITAEEYINSGNDSIFPYFAYDAIKHAIDLNYIDDPDIKAFIDDNEWLQEEDTKCDWTINIDGVKDPDITFGWVAPMIESGEVDGGSATVSYRSY